MTDLITRDSSDCLCTLYGTITGINESAGTADVSLDIGEALSGVEVFYHCENGDKTNGIKAFGVNDEVKLISVNNGGGHTSDNSFIVGFKDGNRRYCSITGVAKVRFSNYAFLWDFETDDYYEKDDGTITGFDHKDNFGFLSSESRYLASLNTRPLFYVYEAGNFLPTGGELKPSEETQIDYCDEYGMGSVYETKSSYWDPYLVDNVNQYIVNPNYLTETDYSRISGYGVYKRNTSVGYFSDRKDISDSSEKVDEVFMTPAGDMTSGLTLGVNQSSYCQYKQFCKKFDPPTYEGGYKLLNAVQSSFFEDEIFNAWDNFYVSAFTDEHILPRYMQDQYGYVSDGHYVVIDDDTDTSRRKYYPGSVIGENEGKKLCCNIFFVYDGRKYDRTYSEGEDCSASFEYGDEYTGNRKTPVVAADFGATSGNIYPAMKKSTKLCNATAGLIEYTHDQEGIASNDVILYTPEDGVSDWQTDDPDDWDSPDAPFSIHLYDMVAR
jgi:hypothetical protein